MPIIATKDAAPHLISRLQKLLQEKAKILPMFNLPTPEIVGVFSHTPHLSGNAQIKFPKIAIPSHKIFAINYLLEVGSIAFYESYFKIKPSYVVTGSERELKTAEDLFNNDGLAQVTAKFKGIWCNRDPYAIWKFLISLDNSNNLEFLTHYPNDTVWEPHYVSKLLDINIGGLEWLRKTAHSFVKRTRMYLDSEPQCIDNEGYGVTALRWNLPTPAREFAYDYLSFKLIPTLDNKLSLAKQFLESLKTINHPIIFEIISDTQSIYFQISCAPKDKELLLHQLLIFFPKCGVVPCLSMQERLFRETNNLTLWQVFSAYPTNDNESLRAITDGQIDPYAQLLSLMADNQVVTQFIFSPLGRPAINTMFRALEKAQNLATFRVTNKELISEARANQIKNAPYSDKKYEQLTQETGSDWQQYHYGITTTVNPEIEKRFKDFTTAITKKQTCWLISCRFLAQKVSLLQKIQKDFLPHFETQSQGWEKTPIKYATLSYPSIKNWKIISTDELSSLVHLLGSGVVAETLETGSATSVAPPESYTHQDHILNQGIVLGENEFRGLKKLVALPHEVRTRHCYVLGKTRTGKSTLLFNCIRQDIELGTFGLKSAVCVIDPHGDLIEDVIQYIPKERALDTIYFDASDRNYPISLNVMTAKNEEEIGQLADDLLVTFKRISESWGERMENILRHCFHTLLHASNTTFLDIQPLLQNAQFRSEILSRVKFQPLLDFWKHQFPIMPKDAAQPILSRMSKFSLSPVLQGILNQKQSRFHFTDIIKNHKVLLVNLSQGKIGEENTKLLGSLIVSQLQMAAMRQASLPKLSRIPIRLYIDEFQNFTTSAFEKILSEAGKYNLCMTVAHQYISQLDEKTRNALLGNIGTMVVFQLGPQDAGYLKHELGNFTSEDIVNLDSKKHQALCKPATQAKDTFKFITFAPPPKPQSFVSQIIDNTRRNYSTRYVDPPTANPKTNATAPAPSNIAQIPPSQPLTTSPSPTTVLPSTPITPISSTLPNPAVTIATPRPASTPIPSPALAAPPLTSSEPQVQPSSNLIQQVGRPYLLPLRREKIAAASPKSFGSTQEKILYYIKQAEYLSSNQIIRLCYGHMKESSRASTSSRDLKLLVEAKKLKVENFGKQKLYFSARSISPTNHNLILRDLFLKILNSNLEIDETNFFLAFKDFTPDLAINFVSENSDNGNLVKTLWEYDAGTEGITELKRKVTRYYDYKDDYIITFIFDTNERLQQMRKSITEPWLTYAVLTAFDSLVDCSFMQGIDLIGRPLFAV